MRTIRHRPEPALSRQRRAFFSELAEGIAAEHSAADGRVDLDGIARAYGVTISRNDYGDAFDGLLECREGRFHIFCNLGGPMERGEGRTRFTVAHELAHFFIPEHRAALAGGFAPAHPSFCDAMYPENYVELEADFFASRLLLPEDRFRAALSQYGMSLSALCDIAALFGASVEATVRRAVEVSDRGVAAVFFRNGALWWQGISRAFVAAGLRTVRVVRADAHPGAATWQAHRARTATGVFRSSTSAGHWFAAVEAGGSRDLLLTEDALKNRFYLVSLLTLNE